MAFTSGWESEEDGAEMFTEAGGEQKYVHRAITHQWLRREKGKEATDIGVRSQSGEKCE